MSPSVCPDCGIPARDDDQLNRHRSLAHRPQAYVEEEADLALRRPWIRAYFDGFKEGQLNIELSDAQGILPRTKAGRALLEILSNLSVDLPLEFGDEPLERLDMEATLRVILAVEDEARGGARMTLSELDRRAEALHARVVTREAMETMTRLAYEKGVAEGADR